MNLELFLSILYTFIGSEAIVSDSNRTAAQTAVNPMLDFSLTLTPLVVLPNIFAEAKKLECLFSDLKN